MGSSPTSAEACVAAAGMPVVGPEVSEAERAAVCALAGLPGVGAVALGVLRSAFGSAEAAVARGGQELARVAGLRADAAEALAQAGDLQARGRWVLERARGLGASVLLCGEPGYPPLLAAAPAPPPVLYVVGTLGEARRVAVVGSRRADDYGLARTRVVVRRLIEGALEVVSGAADGIDNEAHRMALEAGARTVAVVGTGLMQLYPAHSKGLYERIAAQGAIVSEFAPDAGGQRHHFPQRNRTLAGIAEAVVLMRGAADSGALSTCQAAMRLARPVFAVPGQVGDALSEAPNGLLAAGQARVTLDGSEVIRALGLGGRTTRQPAPVADPVPPAAPVLCTEAAKRVWAVLGPAPKHVDEVAAESGLGAADTLAELLRLELDGLCASRPGKYFLRR